MAPKKSLGQNWLTQPRIAEEIVFAGRVEKGDTVLEIGPGRGALTEKILATGAKVVAVEKDEYLIPDLQTKFASEIKSGQLEIISGDILTLEPKDYLPKNKKGGLEKYKLIANIPYYITGEIIRKFLELPAREQPELMVLLVQKEVAERIVGRQGPLSPRLQRGKESILSLSVKIFGEPKLIRRVDRGCFFPVPGVDSAVLLVDNISHDKIKSFTEEHFFELVRKGFSQKRKMLKNNLGVAGEILTACGITEKARAENLTLEQWQCLAKNI